MRLSPGAPLARLDSSEFGWLIDLARPQVAAFAAVLFFSLLATGLALSQPYLTKLLIDDGLLAGSMRMVILVCAGMVGAVVLGAGCEAANRLLYTRLSARVLFALREDLYGHLQTLSPTYYARVKSGDILARLDGDVAEVQRFAVDGPLALINGVFGLVVTLALLIGLSPPLALMAGLLVPLELLALRRLRPLVENRTRALRQSASAVSAFLVETLRAMKFIQAVASEQREAERLRALNNAYLHDLQAVQLVNLASAAIPRLLNAVATASVFAIGGYMTIQGQMTVGTLIAFSTYLARALGPAQTLLGLYLASRRARVSLERVREIIRQAPEVRPPAQPTPLPPTARGEIKLTEVEFGYTDSQPPVLRDADLTVSGGQKLFIIGASGVGKSTLIDLLQRHYDPRQGSILLDGVDLRELDLAELRRRVVVVSQDTVLFPGSLRDNLCYACPEADAEHIQQALALAHLGTVIAALPAGLNTVIGAGGVGLSGGQRQRLAIARAVLQDPRVLILDEATSALDLETAEYVMAEIDRLFADRTRVVITHRLNTLDATDAVVELRDGRLVPRGPG